MSENIQEVERIESKESVFNDFEGENERSYESIGKKKRGNLWAIKPYQIKKGEIRNPNGGRKSELEKIIDHKVKLAVRKADKIMKLQSPGATRRVLKIAKGHTIGEYAPEHMRTVLAANETILDRAGIVAPKGNVIVPVQINIGEDRQEFKKTNDVSS